MPSVGSVTYNFKPVTKTAAAGTLIAYTANNSEMVLVDGTAAAFTVTLPLNPTAGMQAAVKKIDSSANAVTVISGSAATIDTDSSAVLLSKNSSGTFVFDGLNWKVVATSVFNTATSQGIVPAGGAANAVLTKTSGTDYAYSWATAGGGGGNFFPWSGTGRYFHSPLTAANFTTGAVGTPCTFTPIYVPNACTLATVNLYCSTAGYGYYVGVYTDGGNNTAGGPAIRLASGLNANTVVGFNPTTINLVVAAAATYWLAFAPSSTTPGFGCMAATSSILTNMTAVGSASIASPTRSSSYTYGSNPPADVSAVAMTQNTSGQIPIFFFTVS